MPDTGEPADRLPVDGAVVQVTIRRPVGTATAYLRIDEMAWSGHSESFREGAVLHTARTGAHACLRELLAREATDSG